MAPSIIKILFSNSSRIDIYDLLQNNKLKINLLLNAPFHKILKWIKTILNLTAKKNPLRKPEEIFIFFKNKDPFSGSSLPVKAFYAINGTGIGTFSFGNDK